MDDVILVLNAGSSSIKFSVFSCAGETKLKLGGQIAGLYSSPRFVAKDGNGKEVGRYDWRAASLGHDGAIDYLIRFLRGKREHNHLMALGHRVVHGGPEFSQPTLITSQVLTSLEKLIPLAPLHQPHNLVPIRIAADRLPGVPQVACFDTAFHSVQSELARAFALPRAITQRGVLRYGFHGLSYEYIASVLPQFDAKAAAGRVVVAHLGNGASMCAMRAGKSVATTMGFTAAEGLPMGTRSGSIDPGVILYLIDELKLNARQIEKLVYQESGLLGVSGISSDMRTLLESPDPSAQFAVDLFIYRVGRELGSLAAAIGGLDALVFTGGIGEHAAVIRQEICLDASWLGVELDAAANNAGGLRINTESSRVSVLVIPTNEELMIARQTQRVIGTAAAAA
jgi:acetate kinase